MYSLKELLLVFYVFLISSVGGVFVEFSCGLIGGLLGFDNQIPYNQYGGLWAIVWFYIAVPQVERWANSNGAAHV